jgi:type I restriction enzyme S subunit
MKWSRYPQYKDSGIDWLGQIPEHWGSLKICRIGTLRNGLNKDKSAYGTGTRYVTVNDLYEEGYIEQEQLKRMEVTFQEYNQYSLQEHDILFARSSVKREGVGNPGIIQKIQEETVFSGFVIRLRVNNEKANKKYIYWLLRSRSIRDIVVAVSNTVAQTNLSQPNLKSIDICFPSTKEQKKIAAFLDRETSRIDKLIEKKEKQIELLKEKRAALISHAVTKGLDPNVKMKDSDIEWIGEIPEDWDLKRLKYVCTINDETLPENTDPNFELLYVDIGSVDKYIGITKIENLTFKDAPSRARRIVKNGDIIVSTVRTYLRAIASVNSLEDNLVVSTGFAVIRTKDELNKKFASFCLRAGYFVDEVVARSVGVAYPAINSSDLGNIFIAIPAKEEQGAIADFLDRETTRIDKIIEKVQKSIELLKEYRTAIISAAVTGKIDVRGEI